MLNADCSTETEFVEEIFRDLLCLLEDTRSWINEDRLREDHPSLPPEVRIGVTRDLSALTSRATAAMSVVMMYRALREDAGSITDPKRQLDELYAEVERGIEAPAVQEAPALAALIHRARDLLKPVSQVREIIISRLETQPH